MVLVHRAYRDPTSGDVELGSVVDTIAYDGLNRRIVKAVTNSGDLDAEYHYYYRDQSIVEIRNGSDMVLKQYVWGISYIDELIQIGINQDPINAVSGTTLENNCERFFYAIHNANYNVMGLLHEGYGTRLAERYEYTPYGERQVFTHGWRLLDVFNDGIVDAADQQAMSQSGPADSPKDLDGDGDVDNDDWAVFVTYWYESQAPDNDPLVSYHSPTSFLGDPISSLTGIPLNEVGHQGLFHDEDTGLVYNRARMLVPYFARFAQRDPMNQSGGGYQDGLTLYQHARSNPVMNSDPTGLATILFSYLTRIETATVSFAGRTFNGGVKSFHTIVVDASECRIQSSSPYVGETIEYDKDGAEKGRARGSGKTLKAIAKKSRRGGCGCKVTMSGDESNPRVGLSPGITYNVTISIDRGKRTYDWDISHDRYPTHTFTSSPGGRLHHFSHVAAGTSPLSLFPFMPNETDSGNGVPY